MDGTFNFGVKTVREPSPLRMAIIAAVAGATIALKGWFQWSFSALVEVVRYHAVRLM